MIFNSSFVQLQEFGSLSQTSRRQITRLQNMLAVNEAQYQIAMRQIDAQWSSFQEISRQNEWYYYETFVEITFALITYYDSIVAHECIYQA